MFVIQRPSAVWEAERPAFDEEQQVLRSAQDDRLRKLRRPISYPQSHADILVPSGRACGCRMLRIGSSANNPLVLIDCDRLVGVDVLQLGDGSARPLDF